MHICAAVLAALLFACSSADDSPAPVITAQGFRISEPQAGAVGGFGDVKLRIEAPSGIEELRVVERSYEVDLARSPEPEHFPLFGLSSRVWSRGDVTLNFRPYVNQKLGAEGSYTFEITVTDRHAKTAAATLLVQLEALEEVPDKDEPEPAADAARTGGFELQREGGGPVRGGDAFGITWTTVESVSVVIRITGSHGGARAVARLDGADYEGLRTRAIEASDLRSSVELATANDAAAGAIIAVAHADGDYLLRTDHSETSLSALGTTVTLVGRYKHSPH